jgi:hypothetical protein
VGCAASLAAGSCQRKNRAKGFTSKELEQHISHNGQQETHNGSLAHTPFLLMVPQQKHHVALGNEEIPKQLRVILPRC